MERGEREEWEEKKRGDDERKREDNDMGREIDREPIITLSLGDFPTIVKIKTTGIRRISSKRIKMAIKPRTM